MDKDDLKFWVKHSMIQWTRRAGSKKPVSVIKNEFDLQRTSDQLFWLCEAAGYPIDNLHALDLFSGSGLLMTHTYVHRCASADLWEVDPVRSRLAGNLGSNVNTHCGDSIQAVNQQDSRLRRYGLIWLDNSIGGLTAGGMYCEHFELFPEIFGYFDRDRPYCAMVLNFVSDMERMQADERFATDVYDQHLARRTEFYERDARRLRPVDAVARYNKAAGEEGYEVVNFVIIPRHPFLHFLAMFFEPRD